MPVLRPDTEMPGTSRFARSMGGVAQAFKRALVSQCHPTMLFALLDRKSVV